MIKKITAMAVCAVMVLAGVSAFAASLEEALERAKQGDIDAQFVLGNSYYNGEGVKQNYAEAAKWYRQAAEQGDGISQYNLGVLYTNGDGVQQDLTEAVKWFRMAAQNGDENAQDALKQLGQTW